MTHEFSLRNRQEYSFLDMPLTIALEKHGSPPDGPDKGADARSVTPRPSQ